jgi:hypothetical protein
MASAAVVQQGGQDLSSLLSQVKVLESDRERLARELEEARRKIEEEQRRLEEVNSKMGRLTEGKRAEMQQAFDTVIKKWLADSVQDEKVRQEFQTGMSRLVENTAEDSGVWQVRAPALLLRLCILILITCTGCVLCIELARQKVARDRPAAAGDQHAQECGRGRVPGGELAQAGARRGPPGWPTGRAKGYLARL